MLRHTNTSAAICRVFLQRNVDISSVTPERSAVICSEVAVKFRAGFSRWASRVSASPTSPRGPSCPTRPGLRWCRACRRIPGCRACSGPPSSWKPGSSCPAGTCSTTRQPPSPPNLCPLRQERIRVLRRWWIHIYSFLSARLNLPWMVCILTLLYPEVQLLG